MQYRLKFWIQVKAYILRPYEKLYYYLIDNEWLGNILGYMILYFIMFIMTIPFSLYGIMATATQYPKYQRLLRTNEHFRNNAIKYGFVKIKETKNDKNK